MYRHGLELRSKITSGGFLELFLQEAPVPEPAADEIVIRIEAAPLNPSDIIRLLGPADPSVVRAVGTAERPRAVALLAKEHIAGLQARLDVALPVGRQPANHGTRCHRGDVRKSCFRLQRGICYRPNHPCDVWSRAGEGPRRICLYFCSKPFLGRLDTPAKCGLRHMPHFSRSREILVGCQGKEVVEPGQIHYCPTIFGLSVALSRF